ncbi:hypothetical protein [Priestia megaterium]|uniref:hypothetical protein n=1 Tax=Priestia megaterium TaxID=1404 RepID=UPI0032D9353D
MLKNIKDSGYDTKTRNVAYNVAKVSLETGGRISALLKLKSSDIQIVNENENERCKITFYKDKGGLTRTVEVSKETGQYLSSLTQGKKPNQRILKQLEMMVHINL